MQYTLAQACREISTTLHAYGSDDAKAAVNKALQALAGLSGWECLRRVVRIFSAQPQFALPQGCAALVRACVNGRPVTVRGQDFQFLHSGPGDALRPPHGFCMVPDANILDLGSYPVEFTPAAPFTLFAESAGEDEPDLVVKGRTPDGRIVRLSVPVGAVDGSDSDDGPYFAHSHGVHSAAPADIRLADIHEVTVDPCAEHYVDLWCVDARGERVRIATYHPDVAVPTFRRYMVQGARPGGMELLAEVRIDPLPLVEDTDVVPFDTLEPIEWMVQMAWYVKSGEIEAAQKMMQLATAWLKQRETTAAKVQTAVISNSLYRGSLGELSMEAMNI